MHLRLDILQWKPQKYRCSPATVSVTAAGLISDLQSNGMVQKTRNSDLHTACYHISQMVSEPKITRVEILERRRGGSEESNRTFKMRHVQFQHSGGKVRKSVTGVRLTPKSKSKQMAGDLTQRRSNPLTRVMHWYPAPEPHTHKKCLWL